MKAHLIMSILIGTVLVACGGNDSSTIPSENRYKLVDTVMWQSNKCFYTLIGGDTINIFDANDYEKAEQIYTDEIKNIQCGIKDSNNSFIALGDIDLFSNVKSLSLGDNDFTTRIGSLSNISTLEKLNSLYLNTYFDYEKTDKSMWGKLHLKSLYTVNQINELYQIKTLENLEISVFDLSAVQRLSELPNLRHLRVKFEHPKYIDINFISNLENLETLEIGIWADEISDYFPHNPDVTHTEKDLIIDNFSKISKLKKLQKLSIHSLIIQNLNLIEDLDSLQTLSLLDMSGIFSIIYTFPVLDLSTLYCGQNLRKLDLTGSGYQEQALNASCNQLTDIIW